MKRVVLFCLVIIGLTTIAIPPVDAQQKRQRAPKVIQLEEITIEGRVQKPNAFYILNRSNIGYEIMDLRTSFLDKVVSAVNSQPF